MLDCTISIVTYNSARHLPQVIDSLVDSIGDTLAYRIFVVDNASSDDTVLQARKARIPVEIIQNAKNVGFGAAHNKVLPLMDSKYHIVVNPDILMRENAILKLFQYMEANPDVGLVSPRITFPDGSMQYLCKHHPTLMDLGIRLFMKDKFRKRQDWFEMRDTGYDHIFDVEYATGCFMFFRTSIYRKVGGFDEKIFLYLEDADITRQVARISRSVFYPDATVVHEWQRDQHKSLKLAFINLQSYIHYRLKYLW